MLSKPRSPLASLSEQEKRTRNRPFFRWELPDVRGVDGFFLYELGQIASLATLPSDTDLTPTLWLLANDRTMIHDFAEAKENKEDLPNAVDDARDLVVKLDEIIGRKPIPSMTARERSELQYRLFTFRDRLRAELGRLYSYVLEEKGSRSVKTLWTTSLSLLPPTVLPHLSDFTTKNIAEAGKSWIVDRPTATGFHMMRSVECVLRQYKKLVPGRDSQWTDKKGAIRYDGFGTIVNDLNAVLEPLKKQNLPFGRLELVVGILRPLSKLYRDPVFHPELNELTEEDAKLSFEQGLNAISVMIQDSLDGGPHFTQPWQQGITF